MSRTTATLGALLSLILGLSACSRPGPDPQTNTPAPWVRTVAIEGPQAAALVLSGSVRARHETAVAFQIGGRVLIRHVQAGQTVRAGQLLFALDPSDVVANEVTAAALLAAAEAAVATAGRELERQQQLVAQGFVSHQTLERLELSQRQAQSQLAAARAQATLARNARGHTELRALRDGVIVEVTGEVGQVVSPGLSLATLAHAGAREVELFLPQPHPAPSTGQAQLPGGAEASGASLPLTLREVAGAADPLSRSWRARYHLPPAADAQVWALGSVVRVTLDLPASAPAHELQRVPLGALDERAQGPQLWRVRDGQAEPVPVTVLELGATHAHIRSPLALGERVVALGTHRLTPGMAVRELAP